MRESLAQRTSAQAVALYVGLSMHVESRLVGRDRRVSRRLSVFREQRLEWPQRAPADDRCELSSPLSRHLEVPVLRPRQDAYGVEGFNHLNGGGLASRNPGPLHTGYTSCDGTVGQERSTLPTAREKLASTQTRSADTAQRKACLISLATTSAFSSKAKCPPLSQTNLALGRSFL